MKPVEEFIYRMKFNAKTMTVDVEQVGELIRCKECKHWDGYFCHNKLGGDGFGNYTPPIKSEDGFCDWSERRE